MHRTMNLLRRYGVMYSLLIPGLLYFAVFKYVPMVYIAAAFKNYNVLQGLWESPWVGWQNFQLFFDGVYFKQIIGNTILISFYKLVFSFPAPIILALMLNAVTGAGFKRTIQTLTYLPHFLSWVIIYGLLVAFLAPGTGLVNQLLTALHLDRISFLTESGLIRTLIVTTDIWQSVGWGAIIYLAALTGIDPSLYEAATMDGASQSRQLWHITLPGIRNVIILMLVLRLSAILDVGFDQIFIMLNPLNQEKADVIETWVYRVGLQEGRIGLATAVGLFKSVIGFVLVLGANRIAKKFDGQIW
ncbi:putative multiple-sugar transport system permease YteP [Paenibacillus allorhizoplanae]|uniref:Multiple-sugar transport system permease YteP n=1 Tax=Paenibacillus allorhizoplanae TaxID=2905648 RepID=A0ABN8GRI3_9BACL|nr:ABC transporter permease subunit [Paenibacillus allorhizoplanae]CAH1216147.1 putative multiple-sugar transport system permease YteP [Paenibacillus allorhizoplanae]